MQEIGQDYFSLFGLTPSPAVELADLTERYRRLQAEAHPDRFSGRPEQEQRLALQYAAYINEAYQCLRNPLSRAGYLLERVGHGESLETTTHQDVAFLTEQMELRERLQELSGQAGALARLPQLVEEVSARERQQQHSFETAYHHEDYKTAKDAMVKWQFFVKLHREIDKLIDELDG